MNEFEKLHSRVKYYLLDYKDKHLDEVVEKFDKFKLRDFTREELTELFLMANEVDLILMKGCKEGANDSEQGRSASD